jgi:hypothetical protein
MKLQRFLKHNYLVSEHAKQLIIFFLIIQSNSKAQKLQTIHIILTIRNLPGFHKNIQFSRLNSNLHTSLVPFVFTFSKLLKPNDALHISNFCKPFVVPY